MDAGFVGCDNLRFEDLANGRLAMRGRIGCQGDIVIDVSKYLRCQGSLSPATEVVTVTYSYCVSVAGRGSAFRYDNVHQHAGHQDAHHKHIFEDFDERDDSPIWVGPNGWPTLSEVIQEAQKWYWDNQQRLELPTEPIDPDRLEDGARFLDP